MDAKPDRFVPLQVSQFCVNKAKPCQTAANEYKNSNDWQIKNIIFGIYSAELLYSRGRIPSHVTQGADTG